jgi:hypothetical protein
MPGAILAIHPFPATGASFTPPQDRDVVHASSV